MKNQFLIFLLFIYSLSCAHGIKTDTIELKYNATHYKKLANDSLVSRYMFTKKYGPIKENFTQRYDVDSIKAYFIPTFKLKQERLTSYKCSDNFEELIDFNTVLEVKSIIILEKGDRIIGDFLVNFFERPEEDKNKESYQLANSIFFEDYSDPIRSGGNGGYLNKLRLEKSFFTFGIEGLPVRCIIENQKIMVVTDPNNFGTYSKTPINEYVRSKYGRKGIRKLFIEGWNKQTKKCNCKKNKVRNSKVINLKII